MYELRINRQHWSMTPGVRLKLKEIRGADAVVLVDEEHAKPVVEEQATVSDRIDGLVDRISSCEIELTRIRKVMAKIGDPCDG